MTAEDFRTRLAEELEEANKSAIARAIGVSRRTLYDWQEGRQDPSIVNFAALAEHLGCSLDYLWGRTDERTGQAGGATREVLAIYRALSEAGLVAPLALAAAFDEDALGITSPGTEQDDSARPEEEAARALARQGRAQRQRKQSRNSEDRSSS